MNTFYPPTVGCWAYISSGEQSNSAFTNGWQYGFVLNLNGVRISQLCFSAQGNVAPRSRFKEPSTGEWSAWTDI